MGIRRSKNFGSSFTFWVVFVSKFVLMSRCMTLFLFLLIRILILWHVGILKGKLHQQMYCTTTFVDDFLFSFAFCWSRFGVRVRAITARTLTSNDSMTRWFTLILHLSPWQKVVKVSIWKLGSSLCILQYPSSPQSIIQTLIINDIGPIIGKQWWKNFIASSLFVCLFDRMIH